MIVIVSWESVINDLLKNDNKMINQIFVCRRINFGLCLKVVQGASHDTGGTTEELVEHEYESEDEIDINKVEPENSP